MSEVKPFPSIAIREYHAQATYDDGVISVSVNHNTLIGVPSWTREGQGLWRVRLDGAFGKKRTIFVQNASVSAPTTVVVAQTTNYIEFRTTLGGASVDVLNTCSIMVKVYEN